MRTPKVAQRSRTVPSSDKRVDEDRPPVPVVPCSREAFCWFMEKALEGEQGPGRGMATMSRMNFTTGETTGSHVVYRRAGGNKHPVMVARYCPFCDTNLLDLHKKEEVKERDAGLAEAAYETGLE